MVSETGVAAPIPIYIADNPELIISSQQDWGTLGINTAAHAPNTQGELLRIGEIKYPRGLGHHANGSITILLDAQYTAFEAQIGLQPCPGGSVIFRVLVDGQQRFQSPTVRSGDSALPVQVDLNGAQELRLEASDAGDGITCDMANWAEARLFPAADQVQQALPTGVNIASFGRIVTFDAQRKHGTAASRIQEFPAEDLFTETELVPEKSGYYEVPVSRGLGCIGIQWLGRRKLRELVLETESPMNFPAEGVSVEGWFGESTWQGEWRRLSGSFRQEENYTIFAPEKKAGVLDTSKVRWILPDVQPLRRVRLAAFSRSTWALTNIVVQLEKPTARARVKVWNGEARSHQRKPDRDGAWPLSSNLELSVRYSRPTALNSDPTLLQFQLPGGGVSVAVSDVLSNGCVYLPDYGLFVARKPLPATLQEYKRSVAGRRSLLEEVRLLPDQSLRNALARTHHDAQREGPVMLSLACDNTKFVLERNGVLHFHPGPFQWLGTNRQVDWQPWYTTGCELRPTLGTGNIAGATRRLEGGWLPIVVLNSESAGIRYVQRTLVAPFQPQGSSGAPGKQKSICLVEFTATNSLSAPAAANIKLSFLARSSPSTPAVLIRKGGTVVVSDEKGLLGLLHLNNTENVDVSGGDVFFSDKLEPGRQLSLKVFLRGEGMSAADLESSFATTDFEQEAARYWQAMLGEAMQVQTPDELLNNIIQSSEVRCLIDARSEAEGKRVAASIAAMSYGPLESEAHSVIRGMDFIGHPEFARRSLDFFVDRYDSRGFLTTGYTTFGTAWHLWTVGEHYQLTGDTNWLRSIASELARVCDWVIKQTEKTKRLDPYGRPVPEYGLMPPGVLADWNAFACHFTMNAYYSAGLRAVGLALGEIGHPDAARFTRKAEELRRNTLRAYAWTQSQAPALLLRNGTWIPHYPSQVHSPGKLAQFFPGQDAGRSWCYDVELGAHQLIPTGVLEPKSREVTRMMDHMEDVQFLSDGWFDYSSQSNRSDWFNLGGFSKVQPYYTRNCEIYALRDDVKPFIRSYFNSIASLLNPEVLTFWEHFHHSGAWDKTHETGYFLHQTRSMLVQERGSELWLAPLIPCEWLQDGQALHVSNAPTTFGAVSFDLRSNLNQGYIDVTIGSPARRLPRAIVLRLRHPDAKPIRSVLVNGKRTRAFDPISQTIHVVPTGQTLSVRARF